MKIFLSLLIIALFYSCNKGENKKILSTDYLNTDYLKEWSYKKASSEEVWKHPTKDVTLFNKTILRDHVFNDENEAFKATLDILKNNVNGLQSHTINQLKSGSSIRSFSSRKCILDFRCWSGEMTSIEGFVYLFKNKCIIISLEIDKSKSKGMAFSVVTFWNNLDIDL